MEYISNNTFGTLSSAPDGIIVSKIYMFVTTVLKEINGKKDDNENYLTNALCKQLGFKKPPEFPFFFQHQNLEDAIENTSTDFAAFGTYTYTQTYNKEGKEIPLVKFEAKRLCSTLAKKREREYVIGEYSNGKQIKNSGGIERFKNLRHGKDVDNAAIIGYVQTKNFNYWIEKVNHWIQEEIQNPSDSILTWDDEDLLKMSYTNDNLNCYFSNSKRNKVNSIELLHLWVDFTK